MFHFGLDEYSKDMLLSLTIKLVLVHDDDKHLATLKSFSVQRYFKSMETTRCHSNTYYVNLAFTECKKNCVPLSSSNRRNRSGWGGATRPTLFTTLPMFYLMWGVEGGEERIINKLV